MADLPGRIAYDCPPAMRSEYLRAVTADRLALSRKRQEMTEGRDAARKERDALKGKADFAVFARDRAQEAVLRLRGATVETLSMVQLAVI